MVTYFVLKVIIKKIMDFRKEIKDVIVNCLITLNLKLIVMNEPN